MKLNELATLDFLSSGLMSPGDTFFGGINDEKISEFEKFKSPIEHLDTEKLDVSKIVDEVLDRIRLAMETLLLEKKQIKILFSGGADSRLILYTVLEKFPDYLDRIEFLCKIHPSLQANNDRDYLIASKLCKSLGINLSVENPLKSSEFKVVDVEEQQTYLTGLWGGELLGGALINNRTFSRESIEGLPPESKLKNLVGGFHKDWKCGPRFDFDVQYYLLINSRYSCLYNAIGWFAPKRFSRYVETPFDNSHLLDLVFSLSIEFIRDYHLYNEIFKRIPEAYKTAPINNPKISGEWQEGLTGMGLEPKSLPRVYPREVAWSEKHTILNEFCKDHLNRKYAKYLMEILPYIPAESLD